MSHESKKSIFTMPVHEFGMRNPYAHIAFYGFQQATGINYQFGPSYGMLYADPDFWIGADNLFYSQGASRLII